MVSLKELKDKINEVYVIKDDYVIDIILSSAISNRIPISDKPVWLLLIAPSSGGKSAFLNLLNDLTWTVPVDTLTTATFASGFKSSEKDTSLLDKAEGGVIVFKDFTTLTSMNEDGLREIMGQMRAIYDGAFNKKTGNNQDTDWEGKVGIIAGGTIAVQRKMRQFSQQGERFINYVIHQPERKDMTLRAINNQKNSREKEAELRELTADFVEGIISKAHQLENIVVSDLFTEKMVAVADFCTLARSPVILNKKTGKVEWVPEPEMPARMATMLINLGTNLGLMNEDNKINEDNMKAVYKVAFDSIPADRRLILRMLTTYNGARTKTLAVKLSYPTETIKEWCAQLTALKIIERKANSGPLGDSWQMREEYRDVVAEFENILKLGEELTVSPEEEAEFIDMEDEITDPNDEDLLKDIDWGDWTDRIKD